MGVAAAAEALGTWLAAFGQHASAPDRGGVPLGEERLLGLDFLRFAAQRTAGV